MENGYGKRLRSVSVSLYGDATFFSSSLFRSVLLRLFVAFPVDAGIVYGCGCAGNQLELIDSLSTVMMMMTFTLLFSLGSTFR